MEDWGFLKVFIQQYIGLSPRVSAAVIRNGYVVINNAEIFDPKHVIKIGDKIKYMGKTFTVR